MDEQQIDALVENWLDICKIHKILMLWSQRGETAKLVKSKENEDTATWVPHHPEYVFRKTKNWKGWNDFLGINPETEEGKRHIESDKLEAIDYRIVEMTYNK